MQTTLPSQPGAPALASRAFPTSTGVSILLFGLLLPGTLLLAMQTGDALLRMPLPAALAPYRALIDPFVHLAVGLLVAAPLLFQARSARETVIVLALATAGSVLIDTDHIVAARSLSLYAITHLGSRPPTHSIAFALLAGTVTAGASGRKRWGAALALALLSHVLRDASLGGMPYLAWPFAAGKLSTTTYWLAELALYAVAMVTAVQPVTGAPAAPRNRPAFPAGQPR